MPHGEIYPFVFRNPVSASTHLLWAFWGVYLTGLLWKLTRGDRARQVSLACFGASVCVLYAASATYHAVRGDARVIQFLRLVDHSAIYVLIAGTYTPIFAVLLRGRLRLTMLALVWGLAAAGIACKWLLTLPPYHVTVGLYVAGWACCRSAS
jgi:hemolysin III